MVFLILINLLSLAVGSLQNVGDNFLVERNELLTALAVSNLQNLGRHFVVEDNKHLTVLAVSSLQNVGGHFVVEDNDLKFVDGRQVVASDFTVSSNVLLSHIALGGLQFVGRNFKVSSNAHLAFIHLDGLKNVGGIFEVSNNNSLIEMMAGSLTAIIDYLQIAGNFAFRPFNGLPTLTCVLDRRTDLLGDCSDNLVSRVVAATACA